MTETKLPRAQAPMATPTAPVRPLPDRACDAHVHMVGHGADTPLWRGRVEDPAAGTYTQWVDRFRAHQASLGFTHTVFVHSILYGADNTITLNAARDFGPEARAICLVADDVTDETLDQLAGAGCVGVRLNYVHGGILSWEGALRLAPRLAARGMHIQMLLHSHLHMADLADDIRALPVPLVIDHIGWPDLTLGTAEPGFATLCQLVAEGHVHIKLSAAYRLCPQPYDASDAFVAALLAANPERCLWGTDWPHLMLADAALPDAGILLNRFLDVATTEHAERTLWTTPATLFNF